MDIEGTWNLEVSTPFGKHPATLYIERAAGDDAYTGRIDSRLGKAPLRDITRSNNGDFEAVVSLEIQGRTYEARVTATFDDGQVEGKIKADIPLAPPARFKGTKG